MKALLLVLTASLWATATANAETRRVVWQPLERQVAEPDTLYLLDVESEQRLVPGDGGMIRCQPSDKPWTKLVPVPGK